MKQLMKHLFLGSMAAREDDEFIGNARCGREVRPEAIRWFCGMHDLDILPVFRGL